MNRQPRPHFKLTLTGTCTTRANSKLTGGCIDENALSVVHPPIDVVLKEVKPARPRTSFLSPEAKREFKGTSTIELQPDASACSSRKEAWQSKLGNRKVGGVVPFKIAQKFRGIVDSYSQNVTVAEKKAENANEMKQSATQELIVSEPRRSDHCDNYESSKTLSPS